MKDVNNIDESEMYSNEQTVSHNQDLFGIDFKQIGFQFEPGHKPIRVISHKAVILQPYMFKELIKTMQLNIEKYEKKFGKIKVNKKAEQSNVQVEIVPPKETSAYIG